MRLLYSNMIRVISDSAERYANIQVTAGGVSDTVLDGPGRSCWPINITIDTETHEEDSDAEYISLCLDDGEAHALIALLNEALHERIALWNKARYNSWQFQHDKVTKLEDENEQLKKELEEARKPKNARKRKGQ